MFTDFITIDKIFQAWDEFKKGKGKRVDVQLFELSLEDNLFDLQSSLQNKIYRHGGYQAFYVNDPKRRHIHKAEVRDRVVHHLLYSFLYKLFDKTFIYDSYSCRINKGTHKGVKRLSESIRKVSKNYTGPCFALKCDIRKFFASVDQVILFDLLKKKIQDQDLLWLLEEVINGFHIEQEGKGIPLGNLTSQIFANIYMNELDQFIKHELRMKYYFRYADDFIILSRNKLELESLVPELEIFLQVKLKLALHEKKREICDYRHGVDFLGYIVLPHVVLPRTKTKRRLLRRISMKVEEYNAGKISQFSFNQTLQSYLGFLKHANAHRLTKDLRNQAWLELIKDN